MRCTSFQEGEAKEGIAIKKIQGQYAVLLGSLNGNQASSNAVPIFLCPKNPPKISRGHIFSAKYEKIQNVEDFVLQANGLCGPKKKKCNPTLVRICTLHTRHQNGSISYFGGKWALMKGQPKILASFSNKNHGGWSDDLIAMFPNDVITVTYCLPKMHELIITCENSGIAIYDKRCFDTDLKDRRPNCQQERELMRKIKQARCQSTNSHDDMRLWNK